jgi:hypothetical protein
MKKGRAGLLRMAEALTKSKSATQDLEPMKVDLFQLLEPVAI